MILAVIGAGKVGSALANGLQKSGHQVILAHDDPNNESVNKARQANPALGYAGLQQAIDSSDAILLAVPFPAVQALLSPLQFRGQVLIDCTNPVGPGISHGLQSTGSGSEAIQVWAAGAQVVKAFTVYGFENLTTLPSARTPKTVMPFAGNDQKAKEVVAGLIEDLGFEALDCGGLDRALHLEHMTLLWVKMVRQDGHSPYFTWAYLNHTKNESKAE